MGYFIEGCKPSANWKIGAEYEALGVYPENGKAADYYGERGIEAILNHISKKNGYKNELNEGHILALHGAESSITLEPGSQLELSGKQHSSIHSIKQEIDNHFNELLEAGNKLKISFINHALQPLSTLDEIQLIPKPRYDIMYPYMSKVGSLGHRMMKQSSATQISIDYSDEKDALTKFRTAMGLVPIFYSIFANSPILEGKINGYRSYRGHVWTDTDTDRCGILRFPFEDRPIFESYTEYALDAGMYFVQRDGKLRNLTGTSFNNFLENGYKGFSATEDDWILHISTLFPEVRLKQYIEIRCFDSQPYSRMVGVPAMIKGIFYDSQCLEAAWDLVSDYSWEQRLEAYHSSHKHALKGKMGNIPLKELALELINIAKIGLENHNIQNNYGENETIYLEKISEDLENGLCPADIIISKWENEWNKDIKKLINHCIYSI